MALPAGPLPTPFIFAVQTTSASGALTTLTSTTSATAAYLEHLIRGFQDAINSRIFCSNAQEWSHLSNRYQMVSKAPLHINPEADRANDRRPMSVRENLDELKRCCEKSSDYRMTFSEMTTEVDEGKGRAVTLALLRVTGTSCGVQSNGVMTFDWKRTAGSWKLVRNNCFRGPSFEFEQ